MSIDAGAQVTIILFAIGPYVVILNCLGHVLYLGRAPRTKETLPDFHEWCRVTRHPRVFRGLTVVNGHPGIGASHNLLPISLVCPDNLQTYKPGKGPYHSGIVSPRIP